MCFMRKKESIIQLTKEQKNDTSEKIKQYIEENFDCQIGNLQAEIFLEFITENIGAQYYNKAISDAMAYVMEKADDMYILMKEEKK